MQIQNRLYTASLIASFARASLPLLLGAACLAQNAQPARSLQPMTPVVGSANRTQPAPVSRPPARLAAQAVASRPAAPAARPSIANGGPASQPRANGTVGGDAAIALKLARAIDFYALKDYPRAVSEFEAVLQLSPREPGALWYLGLLKLDEGLESRKAAENEPDDALRAQQLDSGRRAFEQARDYLEALLQVDTQFANVQQVRPIEAGLVLAIARLAEGDEAKFRQLTAQAIATLETYDQQTNGKDYLAKFFLGIAHWRLGIYDENEAEKQLAADYFNQTEQLIGPATPPTTAPVSGGADMRTTELAAIRLYVQYYRGIQALDSRDTALGIEMLRRVEQEAAAIPDLAQLRIDAGELANKAEQAGDVAGGPITFFTRPFGPLQFRGNVQMGMGYDSNPLLLGHGTALPLRIPHQDDYFGQIDNSFELTRRLTKAEDNFGLGESLTLGISGDMSHRWYPHIKEYDINQYRGRIFAAWEPWTDIFAYFEYMYSYTLLGDLPFISGNSGFIGLTKRWTDLKRESFDTRTDFYYGYEWRNYLDRILLPYFDRDGAYQLIGMRQSFDLWRADQLWPEYYQKAPKREQFDAKRFANLFVGYEYREERTQGSEFDLGGHSALAGIEVPLPWRLSAGYQVRFNWDNYSHPSLFDFTGDERFDFRQVHGILVSYIILGRGEKKGFESLEVRLKGFAEVVLQDSNVTDSRSQDIYSYNRGQYGLALQISF